MPFTVTRAIAASAVVLIATFFAACGGDDTPEPAAETAEALRSAPDPARKSRVKVVREDEEGNPVEFTGTDVEGNAFQAHLGEDLEVDDYFAADIPTFPGATPMASMAADGQGAMVSFRSTDGPEKILDFYQSALPENGWSIDQEKTLGAQQSLEASKGDRKLSISISGTAGGTRISVLATQQK